MKFEWVGRQLVSVQNGEDIVSYTYNSDGIRTSKTVNGITTTYQLEGSKIVSETTDGNVTWYIYDENGTVTGFQNDEGTYYFEKNAQGDIVRIFGEEGNCVSEYIYDAWGNIVEVLGDEEIAKINPFRYRGYYQDNETGFYYLQSRYYDCVTGRFLNADSIQSIFMQNSYILSTNIFGYCFNNCVNYIDYTGYVVTPANVIGGLIGALGGAVIGKAIANYFNLGWPWNKLVIASTSALLTVIGWFAGPSIYAAVKSLVIKAITTCTVVFQKSQEWILKAIGIGQKYIRQALRIVNTATIKFTNTAMSHMANSNRYVPREALVNCIKHGIAKADKQGTNAIMYTIDNFYRNGIKYSLEVLFDWETMKVLHFKYWR